MVLFNGQIKAFVNGVIQVGFYFHILTDYYFGLFVSGVVDILTPDTGRIPYHRERTPFGRQIIPSPGIAIPESSACFLSFVVHRTSMNMKPSVNFTIQYTSDESKTFKSYDDLKRAAFHDVDIIGELDADVENLHLLDPFMFNLFIAIKFVEKFGDDLRSLISVRPIEHSDSLEGSVHISSNSTTVTLSLDRLDIYECQQLLRCPNGTRSVKSSTSITDCVIKGNEILQRRSLIDHFPNFELQNETRGKLSKAPVYRPLNLSTFDVIKVNL